MSKPSYKEISVIRPNKLDEGIDFEDNTIHHIHKYDGYVYRYDLDNIKKLNESIIYYQNKFPQLVKDYYKGLIKKIGIINNEG
jgi:hypothetical protein